jgi:hypothetical protein
LIENICYPFSLGAQRRQGRDETIATLRGLIRDHQGELQMATTELPPSKEKAHEIARRIANERPLKKDKDAPESNVSGGFNQKSRPPEDDGDTK